MTNLNDRIREGEEVSPGADIDVPSGRLTLTSPAPSIATGPEAVTVLIEPGIITIGAQALDEPASSAIAASFNFLRAPNALGRVFAEILGPGGDVLHPTLDGLEGNDAAPGGFGPCSGRVSERYYKAHRDALRQDAKLVVYLEKDNTCLHAGRITTPVVSGGAVTIASRGHAHRAEKLSETVLYSTKDMSIWTPLVTEPDDIDPRPWTVETQTLGFNAGEVSSLSFRGPFDGVGGDARAWLPGQEPARVTGRIEIGSISPGNGARVEIWTNRVGFSYDLRVDEDTPDIAGNIINWEGTIGPNGETSGVLEFDVDLTVDSAALSFPNSNPDNRGGNAGIVYPDLVQFIVGNDEDIEAPLPVVNVDIVNIVVYGSAGPIRFGDHTMSPTALVLDIAGRMGLRLTDVQPHGGNILPYSLPAGMPYAEALDWASLLTGWRWRIRDTGHRAILEFGPWDTQTWQVASPWARLDVVGMDRFNRARIPFVYKDGETPGDVLVRADPDPLDHRSFYGLLSLDHPAMNSEAAENLGVQVLKELAKERNAAQFSVGEIVGPQGPVSGHHLMAGDMLDGTPRGAPGGLRIVSKRWGYGFVEGQAGFDGSSGSSGTGIPALDRMLARRTQRLVRRGRAA